MNVKAKIWNRVAFLCFQSIFIFYVIKWSPVKYGSVEYPFWAHGIGFVMSAASMLWIPGYAVYYIMTERGSLRDVGKINFFPNPPYCVTETGYLADTAGL